jgi:hypothetical protein
LGPFSGHGLPVVRVSKHWSFYDVRNSVPTPNPNLKDQRISASRASPVWVILPDLDQQMPLRKDGPTEGVG